MDSGILYLCELKDVNELISSDYSVGDMPHEELAKINRHWYEERMVGMNRQYLAKGVNEQVDMLVRIHFDKQVQIGMYAVLGNGEQYRITNVSRAIDEDGLRYVDLTLQRLEDYFNVAG